jgi:hypothetical protein
MLESQQFLIVPRSDALKSRLGYVILDPASEVPLGSIEEQLSGLQRVFRWFISQRLSQQTLEVREQTDQALVFTIHREWYLVRPTVEFFDSMGTLLGTLKSRGWLGSRRAGIQDQYQKTFAWVDPDQRRKGWKITTPDRAVELGSAVAMPTNRVLVELHEDLHGQPLAKMLLLGSVVALMSLLKRKSMS